MATASGEINAAWKNAGRHGKAVNALSLVVKAGRRKRASLKGERGSRYSAVS